MVPAGQELLALVRAVNRRDAFERRDRDRISASIMRATLVGAGPAEIAIDDPMIVRFWSAGTADAVRIGRASAAYNDLCGSIMAGGPERRFPCARWETPEEVASELRGACDVAPAEKLVPAEGVTVRDVDVLDEDVAPRARWGMLTAEDLSTGTVDEPTFPAAEGPWLDPFG